MTLDDLSDKIDKRFDNLDNKLDSLSLTVTKHGVTLNSHDREFKEVKAMHKSDNDNLESRIGKLERWMWFSLGAGGAAGAGIAKLFLS